MKKYQQRKEEAREQAKAWQIETSNTAQTWGELARAGAYFEKIAKRFGLVKEFRENGII